MFIINITYKVSLDKVDTYLEEHIAFLDQQYKNGVFHLSGKKNPRNGGVIISLLENKDDLIKALLSDPFKIHELADYEVIEFLPSKSSKEFEFLI